MVNIIKWVIIINNYKKMVILLLMLTIIGTYKVSALINYNGLFVGKIIYLDAGHGGVDPGAIYKELKESNINLNFSKVLGNKLERLGAIVLYIRDGDYDLSSSKTRRKKSDLSNRIKAINDSNADLYLSIHVNSDNNSNWHGAQVFYSDKNDNNIMLAEEISKALKKENVSKRKVAKINDIYMYDRVNSPGILLEVGFISNYTDRKNMQNESYINDFSNVIIKGIFEYFRNIQL